MLTYIKDAKNDMIDYLNGEPITEAEWLIYMERIMEEAERRKEDDYCGE